MVNNRKKAQIEMVRKINYIIITFIIIIYSILMTIFSTFGKSANLNLNNLIIIPIVGQMLHFYLDRNYGNLVSSTIEKMF